MKRTHKGKKQNPRKRVSKPVVLIIGQSKDVKVLFNSHFQKLNKNTPTLAQFCPENNERRQKMITDITKKKCEVIKLLFFSLPKAKFITFVHWLGKLQIAF